MVWFIVVPRKDRFSIWNCHASFSSMWFIVVPRNSRFLIWNCHVSFKLVCFNLICGFYFLFILIFLLRLICFYVLFIYFFVDSCLKQISKCFKNKMIFANCLQISKGQSVENQNCRALHCKVRYASHNPSINFINVFFIR